jgi:hypothetical protein
MDSIYSIAAYCTRSCNFYFGNISPWFLFPWFRIGQLVNIDQTTLIRMEDIPREVIEQIIRSDRRGIIL